MEKRKILKMSLLFLSFAAVGGITLSVQNKIANSAEARLIITPIEWEGGTVDTTPKITFFAHGLGGRARDWSNDYSMVWSGDEKFAYDSSSIIEKMRTEYKNQIRFRNGSICVFNL